jgi:nucleoside-triphosphatase THEP1
MKLDFIMRYNLGYAWESTNYYKQIKQSVGAEAAIRVCENIDNLYESIAKKYEVNQKGTTTSDNVSLKSMSEIIVVIDESGQIYLLDGRHRLFIAQILDIEVPVLVGVRHKNWQKLRDENSNSESPIMLDHPDMEDVVP